MLLDTTLSWSALLCWDGALIPAHTPVVACIQDGEREEAIQHGRNLLPVQLVQVADDLTVRVGGKLLVGALRGRNVSHRRLSKETLSQPQQVSHAGNS
jgi:hypothetical protein